MAEAILSPSHSPSSHHTDESLASDTPNGHSINHSDTLSPHIDSDVYDGYDDESPEDELSPHFSQFRRAISFSVILVISALFLDALLYSLPIPFLSVLLSNAGNSSFQIGLFYAIKPAAQIVFNPFVGYINNHIGAALPLCISAASIFISCCIFGVVDIVEGTNYFVYLCLARGIQGIGTATAFSSGFSHIASVFKSDEERGEKMSLALGFSGASVMVAPPLGAVLYHFFDEHVPFWVCGGFAAIQTICLIYVFYIDPSLREYEKLSGLQEERKQRPSYLSQLRPLVDLYIVALLGLNMTLQMGLCGIEFLLPIYLSNELNASSLILGLIFVPASFGYVIVTPIAGKLAGKFGRILSLLIGTICQSVCYFIFPLCPTWWVALLSMIPIGLALGLIDGSFSTVLAYLLDTRHGRLSGYAIIYSATDISVQMGFLIGSVGGSLMNETIGFTWTLWVWGIVTAVFIVIMAALRRKGIDEGIKKEYEDKEKAKKEKEERKKKHKEKTEKMKMNGETLREPLLGTNGAESSIPNSREAIN